MRDIEEVLSNWGARPAPEFGILDGQYVRLAPLTVADADAIYQSQKLDKGGESWRYMPVGPYETLADVKTFLSQVCNKSDPMFFSIYNKEINQICGFSTYLRITPDHGSIEVGYIYFSPLLQQTRAATEAMYLMMKNAFDLGYRRYEWKCNAANQPSMRAAKRLGFTFEGVFRQMMVVKGKNRDTAWYSVLDGEWPALDMQFQKWLSPDNFDADGRQIVSLSSLTESG